MADAGVDQSRRRFLVAATSVVGGAGAVTAVVPFLAAWQPSARARAAGAPVEVDISKIEPGQLIRVEWRGKPVWVLRRTQAMLDALPGLDSELADPSSAVASQQPAYANNPYRSIKQEFLILVGICTHLGCSPAFRPDVAPDDLGPGWMGGFFCACHGSRFDLAGRVYRGVPAPTNLVVPPHMYVGDARVLVGEDGGAA